MPAPDAAELLRLVKGSPQLTTGSLAERMGASDRETEALVERLQFEGPLRRDGDRLLVVEDAASQAPPDQPTA